MMTIVVLATALLTTVSSATAPRYTPEAERALQMIRFKVVRDFSLHFTQALGAAETKRRVTARFRALQRRFADKVTSSDITWAGDEADVRVEAFGQSAAAHVSVTDTTLDLRVHLPMLLAPLGGNIQTFLNATASDMLK